jgi:hypothetical protein
VDISTIFVLTDFSQELLASETYLNALISLLSQHRSFAKWADIPGINMPVADFLQGMAILHLTAVLDARSDLFTKFTELNGLHILVDILTRSNEPIKVEVLNFFSSPPLKLHLTVIAQLGVIPLLTKLATESKLEVLRKQALLHIAILQSTNLKKNTTRRYAASCYLDFDFINTD